MVRRPGWHRRRANLITLGTATTNLVEGKETGSDGVTTVYGANWEILSQKGDTSKLGDALTTAELVGVPTSIQSALGRW